MSLDDSTSLSQLADYILKLAQVGALLPDQELEDFLRRRADLPPANPDAVKKRGKKDDQLRREIVTGGGQNGDAYGANAKAGKHGNKSTPVKSQGATGSASNADNLSSVEDIITLGRATGLKHRDFMPVGEDGRRVRHRTLRDAELAVDLDAIEDYLDDLPDRFARKAQGDAYRIAYGRAVGARGRSNAEQAAAARKLRESLRVAMDDAYSQGRDHAFSEIDSLAGDNHALQLARNSVRDRGAAGIDDRVDHAARYLESAIELAADATRLNHGDSAHRIQADAEAASDVALRQVAQYHGQGAYMQGRHDMILEASTTLDDMGVLYTALLDNSTCSTCEHADDGVVRALSDPVRLDRRPPNRHCLSNLSGRNHCRCFEIPVRMSG
jgi:hypothetical protein